MKSTPTPMIISQRFAANAYQQAASKVFLQGIETVTYGQLRARIEKLTTYYRSAELTAGHTVLLAVTAPARFSELFLALLVNGIGVIIANPLATRREARYLMEQTAPHGLIVDRGLLNTWGLADSANRPGNVLLAVAPDKQKGLLGRLLGGRGAAAPEEANQYPALVDALPPTTPHEPDDNALTGWVIQTSGTTSDPKNVVASRRALLNTLRCRSEKFAVTADSKILNVLSLSQGDGLGQGPLLAFYTGATWVRPAEFQHQTLPVIQDAIYTYKVSHFITVPAMMNLMLRLGDEHRDCFDTGDFKLVVSTAAALAGSLWEKFEQTYGVEVANLYALSECTTALFSGPDAASRRLGSLGKPYGCEIRIVAPGELPSGSGETGELWLRGASLMDGYLHNDAATSQCMVDGWLRTGDLVERDGEGFIRLTGRLKEMINFAGHSLNPAEIAEALESHPAVLEAGVMGLNHDEWGEIPVAVVVSRHEMDISASELMGHCRSMLTEYKLPREIVFTAALPRTANGKLNASLLLDLYNRQRPATTANWNEKIVAIAQSCFRTSEPLPAQASPATVSGWDSLAHMELILAVEREFSIRFTTREIMTVETLGGLTELVGRKLAEH